MGLTQNTRVIHASCCIRDSMTYFQSSIYFALILNGNLGGVRSSDCSAKFCRSSFNFNPMLCNYWELDTRSFDISNWERSSQHQHTCVLLTALAERATSAHDPELPCNHRGTALRTHSKQARNTWGWPPHEVQVDLKVQRRHSGYWGRAWWQGRRSSAARAVTRGPLAASLATAATHCEGTGKRTPQSPQE